MARNNGQGFRLPTPDGTAHKHTAPIPEMSDGGEWIVEDSPMIQSNAELANAGPGGIMRVPIADDSPGAALVRAHELGHARWTPRNLPDAMVNDAAMQLAEDCRMWQRLASSGVDCSAVIAPPDEWLNRIMAGPPRSYLLGMAVATAGTGDGAEYRKALRSLRPDADELIDIAEAIVGRMAEAGPWPTFADTLAAADCIREVRPPEDEQEQEQEGGEGTPGDGGPDGQGGGNGEGTGEPADGEAGDGKGSGASDADGDNEGDGAPGDNGDGDGREGTRPRGPLGGPPSGGGMRQPPRPGGPKPIGASKAAITRRLNRQAKAEAEARAEAREREREIAEQSLSLAERAAGERTAEQIREALAYYALDPEDGGQPGDLVIKPVPLRHRLPAKMRGTAYRSSSYGGRIGAPSRVNTDGVIFRNRRMTRGGGTVLIDCSGSMSFSVEDVEKILQAAPAVTIATYNGSGSHGELRIVAARGRRADSSDLIPPYGGNIVDVPALEWLGRQPSRPRLWVSDGLVTAAGDSLSSNVAAMAERIVRKYGIARVENVSELLKLAEDGGHR